MFPYLIQGPNIVVVVDNKPYNFGPDNICYNEILEGIKNNDENRIRQNLSPKTSIANYTSGTVRIEGDTLYWKNVPFNNYLTRKIVEMKKNNFNVSSLIAFMENIMKNPSKRAVDELYGFLEVGKMPITEDGHFLAYKKVTNDYLDCHTRTINNRVGQIVEMERNAVDDNKEVTCSTGLHFCSEEYLKQFNGDRIMIVKINPRDVVSIPIDYNNTKGRCCRYEVVGEIENLKEDNNLSNSPVNYDWTPDFDDTEDDDEDSSNSNDYYNDYID